MQSKSSNSLQKHSKNSEKHFGTIGMLPSFSYAQMAENGWLVAGSVSPYIGLRVRVFYFLSNFDMGSSSLQNESISFSDGTISAYLPMDFNDQICNIWYLWPYNYVYVFFHGISYFFYL